MYPLVWDCVVLCNVALQFRTSRDVCVGDDLLQNGVTCFQGSWIEGLRWCAGWYFDRQHLWNRLRALCEQLDFRLKPPWSCESLHRWNQCRARHNIDEMFRLWLFYNDMRLVHSKYVRNISANSLIWLFLTVLYQPTSFRPWATRSVCRDGRKEGTSCELSYSRGKLSCTSIPGWDLLQI